MQNFLPKLQQHLLPRVLARLHEAGGSAAHATPDRFAEASASENARHVVLKHSQLYHHKLARFNYTTYDVRRAHDVINPGNNHADVMLLAGNDSAHRFLYARVLGVYHADVIYIGPGSTDYEARRFDVLWVRWFDIETDIETDWQTLKLPTLAFPPLDQDEAFGWVDPADVLRACHIIPAFRYGQRDPEGGSRSRCAKDSKDWHKYYVGW